MITLYAWLDPKSGDPVVSLSQPKYDDVDKSFYEDPSPEVHTAFPSNHEELGALGFPWTPLTGECLVISYEITAVEALSFETVITRMPVEKSAKKKTKNPLPVPARRPGHGR